MRTLRLFFILIAAMGSCIGSSSVSADSWMPAGIEAYHSKDKSYKFTVYPREISSPLDYFRDAVKEKKSPGQKRGGNAAAGGVLEKLDATGQWQKLWSQSLVNEVSPVSAMITNSGQYVVTFDNWHSVGHGDSVIAIYGKTGELIRKFALTDIITQDHFAGLPRSVSSLRWAGIHGFSEEEDVLNLQILFPKVTFDGDDSYLSVEILLKDGAVLPIDSEQKNLASAQAAIVKAVHQKHADERAAFIREPLYGPKKNAQREWHRYLREAFSRLSHKDLQLKATVEDLDDELGADSFAGDDIESTSTTVLRNPDAENYKISEVWMRLQFLDGHYEGNNVSIATIDPDNFVRVISDIASILPDEHLEGSRFYFALEDKYMGAVRKALQGKGGILIQMDPNKPIDQPLGRLNRMLPPKDS